MPHLYASFCCLLQILTHTHTDTVANTFICWPVGGNEWEVACGVLVVWPEVPRSSNYMCTLAHSHTWAACVCVRVWSVIHSFLQINEPYTKTNKFNWITLLGIAIECSPGKQRDRTLLEYSIGWDFLASRRLHLSCLCSCSRICVSACVCVWSMCVLCPSWKNPNQNVQFVARKKNRRRERTHIKSGNPPKNTLLILYVSCRLVLLLLWLLLVLAHTDCTRLIRTVGYLLVQGQLIGSFFG